VHAGERLPKEDYTPVVGPIHPAVAYTYESMDELDTVLAGEKHGYAYRRYGSPTVSAFETAMAELEGGEAAYAVSSGMAAVHLPLLASGVRAGSTVVGAFDVYGATFSLLGRLMPELGARVRMVDVTDLEAVEEALSETHPAALVAETISNPLLKVADVGALVELSHRNGVKVLLDNTFASPYLCTPIEQGVDFVIHSATKYIGGHGDVVAGVVVTSSENHAKLYELNKMVGSVLGPFEAWLAMRGLKTLPLRVCRQCSSAMRVAEWLAKHPKVKRVNYPGLRDHPQHRLANRLFNGKGFGGVLSFEINGADQAGAFRFMDALELCVPATSLGDIYTLVLHPATSSHRALSAEERRRFGIGDGLVRLSTGIEEPEDIISDLQQALTKV
jgi:cystathionine gamma-synthase/methionine-gamma-lyase